jgi:hypothetical protein
LRFDLIEKGEDVGVSSIGDSKNGDSVVSTTGGSQVDVVTSVMVDHGISEEGVVIDFGLDDRGGIGRHKDGFQVTFSE